MHLELCICAFVQLCSCVIVWKTFVLNLAPAAKRDAKLACSAQVLELPVSEDSTMPRNDLKTALD